MANIIEVRRIEKRLESLRIKDPAEWKGKTIAVTIFAYEQRILILFSDGKWSLIGTEAGYDDDHDTLTINKEFYPIDNMADFLELGLATEEEVVAVNAYKQSHRDNLNRQRDLEQLERLKAKYGDSV